jgi:hypothetical protein
MIAIRSGNAEPPFQNQAAIPRGPQTQLRKFTIQFFMPIEFPENTPHWQQNALCPRGSDARNDPRHESARGRAVEL